ncbi:MAG: NAD(P)-dependent oxidoreductase [Lachnospiraceae bacterium]|nr:NAD(P)-dependent oxidoreductase [Lachnospiraceae bacterium]
MISLVGFTGFVGSNIYSEGKAEIDRVYNSQNIEEAYGTEPDLLIYSGMRAEKYLANSDPEADMQLVYQAQENIKKINPHRLVLISTVDVFGNPNEKTEDATIETDGLHPYGLNRYRLEQWVRENYSDALIIRLPGLYGNNIKKNFIYDYINIIPFMLKETKFDELTASCGELSEYYTLQDNGFYKCRELEEDERKVLKKLFLALGFTALNFTDSRSVYQFYPLSRLWRDIQTAIKAGITMWHPATEPVSSAEVYKYLTGQDFINEINTNPIVYDYRTKYADVFGGKGEYLMSKEEVLEDIKRFVSGKLQ